MRRAGTTGAPCQQCVLIGKLPPGSRGRRVILRTSTNLGAFVLRNLFLQLAAGVLAFAMVSAGARAREASDEVPQSERFAFWPGAEYDSGVPTLEAVVGHESGLRITRPADAIRYLEALAEAAPERMRLIEYGRSWENRPLVYAIIGAPDKIAKLDDLRAGMQALRDPRKTSDAQAGTLIDSLPSTVFLAYSVHGNEISPTDAALLTAYHLLAAKDDPTVEKIMANTVVMIDPLLNPDGRARFVHNFETTEGLENSGSRIAAERNEPWPGGRTNHYLFDLNRDWFALTQPETQARIKVLREWTPLVFVDAHEMGTDSTYYFAPEAVPYNPNLAADQRGSLQLFGRNNAKWFDRYGFDYFTREVYDAFFPGYGASWPSYYGAVAMTYEQSSARGLKAERTNGTRYDYRDTVRQHFVASIATAETTAENREKLLRDFWAYQKSAIEEGLTEDVRSYVFPATKDRAAAYRLADLLSRQGVEVRTATRDFTACGKTYQAGARIIPLAQPAKRLIRTLLDPDIALDENFVKEQERRREKDLADEIYDVTAWSMPLMHNVEMDACDVTLGAGDGFADHDGRAFSPRTVEGPADAVAYVAPWGERPAIRLLSLALADGLTVKSADRQFTASARQYPAGSLIFTAAENPDDLRDRLDGYAQTTGAEIIAVSSTWVDDGPNFGSRNVVRLRLPRVAIAWDAPTSAYIAGNTRFVVERQLGLPVTAVRAYDLTDRALAQFDVLILPGQTTWYGGGYDNYLGVSGASKLKAWVQSGGVLIATGGATRWLADPRQDLLAIRREKAVREVDKPNGEDENDATVPGVNLVSADLARRAIAPESETPDPIAGVLARAAVDPDHWLGAGVNSTIPALLSGGDIYTPIKLDKGVNAVRFVGADDLIASGYAWEDTALQFAYKPLVVVQDHGAGTVVGFTQNPAFRAQMDGLNTLLANALFRGPAHSRKLRAAE